VYQSIERDMYRELGIPVSMEEQQAFMGTAERSMWTHFCRKYDVKQPVEELVQEERRRFMLSLEEPGIIPLMAGLIPLLEDLKAERIPCWIASSSSADIIARVIQVNGLENYFRGFVSGDDVSQSKPSPEIFLKAAVLAETDPLRCAVIEDSINGVRAALNAGMAVVGLSPDNGNGEELEEANLLISDLSEITADRIRELLI
jgi:HAD superfamily hydrolase (TIGR01509 family)